MREKTCRTLTNVLLWIVCKMLLKEPQILSSFAFLSFCPPILELLQNSVGNQRGCQKVLCWHKKHHKPCPGTLVVAPSKANYASNLSDKKISVRGSRRGASFKVCSGSISAFGWVPCPVLMRYFQVPQVMPRKALPCRQEMQRDFNFFLSNPE